MLKYIILCFVFLINCNGKIQPGFEKSINSPDGKIELKFILQDGFPKYTVTYNKQTIIDNSNLGFRFKNAQPLLENFIVTSDNVSELDETWNQIWGASKKIKNHYDQLIVNIQEKTRLKRKLGFVFRAFNDGVAFRYILPEQSALDSFQIASEETQFKFTGNHTAWWIPADFDSYEYLYKKTSLQEISSVNTPLTLRTKMGLHISIHEADLTDYPGMTLRKSKTDPLVLESNLVPWPDGVKVKGKTPHRTPWRTIQISGNAGGLIESNIILNLNEPNKIEDTSWIKPMKYVGIWWGMHIGKHTWHAGPNHGATTERAKKYINFAHQNNIGGVLIEGWNKGWESWLGEKNTPDFTTPYPDFNLEEVAKYARDNGVCLIGHHESGGNVPNYERQIEDAFKLYHNLGIHAVKTGYAGRMYPQGQHHHGQFMVNHYRMVVKLAAKYHLMIDAHEPIKPTGIRRTWPNMMTREGVRGMEYNAWAKDGGNTPEHTTILPFTRMLAGPLDYTPGVFDLFFEEAGRPDNRVHTTLAKQLALFVVLYSPLQMASDLVDNYKNQPTFEFIRNISSDWDTSFVINGEIGDFVTIARKSGKEWFAGSITDEEQREFKIDLNFLDKNAIYIAHLYHDTPQTDWESNPLAIGINQFKVKSSDSINLRLAKGGGSAIRFTAVTDQETAGIKSIKEFNKSSGTK